MKLKKQLEQLLARVAAMQIPIYAGNASFFLLLSVFPIVSLLLSLLPYTPLTIEHLLGLCAQLAPEWLLRLLEYFIRTLYGSSSAAIISASAVLTLWSASKGMLSLLYGLDAVLEVHETRRYLHRRLLCVLYTVGMLLALLLTLGLYVGGQALAFLLARGFSFAAVLEPILRNLHLYSFVLLTALFTGVFLALPDKRQRFVHVLPGAAGAACAWVIYSEIYSWYVNHIAKASALYGSLSVLLLAVRVYFHSVLRRAAQSRAVRLEGREGEAGMFGYVIADLARLDEGQQTRYKSFYCGLCRALYRGYGPVPALALTYDMAFLTLFLSALYEPAEQSGASRCLRHPAQAQSWTQTAFTGYAAAMNCLLAYENRRDDWHDDQKLSAAAAAGLLGPGAKRAAAQYPEKAAAIRAALQTITQAEEDRTAYSEAPANAFGELMAELFTVKADRRTPVLRQFGRSLGKLIYFMDAACDLEEDRKKGQYNPLALLGVQSGADFRPQLTLLAGDAAEAFERLPIVQDAAILQNILYSGVWTRFEAAFRTKQEEPT